MLSPETEQCGSRMPFCIGGEEQRSSSEWQINDKAAQVAETARATIYFPAAALRTAMRCFQRQTFLSGSQLPLRACPHPVCRPASRRTRDGKREARRLGMLRQRR